MPALLVHFGGEEVKVVVRRQVGKAQGDGGTGGDDRDPVPVNADDGFGSAGHRDIHADIHLDIHGCRAVRTGQEVVADGDEPIHGRDGGGVDVAGGPAEFEIHGAGDAAQAKLQWQAFLGVETRTAADLTHLNMATDRGRGRGR